MLMAKAKWFAAALGDDNFADNTGWLQRFKNHHKIVGKTISGESGAVISQDIQQWISKEWPEICAKFSPAAIFNADETGLFWQTLPSKTLDVRGSTCHGGKMSKVRVNVDLLEAIQMMTGTWRDVKQDTVASCFRKAVVSLADENIVAAVAGTQADSSSGDEDRPDEGAATRSYSAAEVGAAFSLIHRCCGDMEGTGLSHLNSLDKIEVKF
ncbi:tigger transposable element-derived protein 6-like [Dermacentor albipictus]|uniref:tigger transposable element-derived protein 6-like n=1 Tax=Dermacentor albipictus TaxID=60249 RepID=UPI0038FC6F64